MNVLQRTRAFKIQLILFPTGWFELNHLHSDQMLDIYYFLWNIIPLPLRCGFPIIFAQSTKFVMQLSPLSTLRYDLFLHCCYIYKLVSVVLEVVGGQGIVQD